ncbi:MAG: hypothetical protein WCO96_07100 [Actinomycetes bacterium]
MKTPAAANISWRLAQANTRSVSPLGVTPVGALAAPIAIGM